MSEEEKAARVSPDAEAGYAAFLLRVWRVAGEDGWRIVIEEIGAERRQGCIDWNEVLDFVRRVLAARAA